MLSRNAYRLKVLRCLVPQAKDVKWFFALLLFLTLLSTALSFVAPLVYKVFIDDVILGKVFSQMTWVVLGYLSVYGVTTLVDYVKYWANYKLVNRVVLNTRQQILNNYLYMPFAAYDTMGIGDMKLSIDDDTTQISDFASKQSIEYFFAYCSLVFSACFLLYIDWRLALFAIISIPLSFAVADYFSKGEKAINAINRRNNEALSTWLHATLQGWREVRAMNLELHVRRMFYQFYHTQMLINARWINYWTTRVLIIPQIKDEFVMRFGLYFLGGYLIMNNQLKISDLLVFSMYYDIFAAAVARVSSTDADLQSNMPFTDRLMENVSRESWQDSVGVVPSDSNDIVFDKVSFRYPGANEDVINNVSLRINKGERVAIVGRSGGGKTTLLKLLMGMLIPSSGTVLFAGIDVQEVDLTAMHSRIGFVMQENILFNASIRENLYYGKQDASDEEMRDACERAYIWDFINELPGGLDTTIGEKGIKLSGGQRQRLVLARVFLRDIDIIIFDEATSALDQHSESIVQDAMRSIGEDKTLIIVAHRESSIALCDRRIVIG